MKKKRTIFTLALTLMLFSSVVAMAASVSNTYNYGKNIDATVHGYIDFLEGPLTIEDKVYYNAAIIGTEKSKCTVAYSIIVDNSIKSQGVLDKNKYNVSVTDLKVGYDHEYATLKLQFNGKTKTMTSFAD